MDHLEMECRDLRLAEQAILKQALDEKSARVERLDSEVRFLRSLLDWKRHKTNPEMMT